MSPARDATAKTKRMQQMILEGRCPICEKRGIKVKIILLMKRTHRGLTPVTYKKRGVRVRCGKCVTGGPQIYDFPFVPKGKILRQDEIVEGFVRDQTLANKEADAEVDARQVSDERPGSGHFVGAELSDDAPAEDQKTDEPDSHSPSSSDPSES